ncbi:MAG: rhodanese-like domain-containing protein [Pyrinomonadaceae bacterium]
MKPQRSLTFLVAVLLALSTLASARFAGPAMQDAGDGGRISLVDFKALLASNQPVLILDVRSDDNQKIKGARHIPLAELEARLNELPRDREIVTYCA